jgi:hypothetical protein
MRRYFITEMVCNSKKALEPCMLYIACRNVNERLAYIHIIGDVNALRPVVVYFTEFNIFLEKLPNPIEFSDHHWAQSAPRTA